MATQSRKQSRNGAGNGRAKTNREPAPRGRQEYEEEPGWGSAFHREENSPPQPSYTGTGVLDEETLKAIFAADGEFQISLWPRRAKSGAKYLRLHIEPPFQGSEDDELDDDEFAGPAGDSDGSDTPW